MNRKIDISQKREQADLIIQNAKIADVFNLRWREGSIVVADGKIIAIDEHNEFQANETVRSCGAWYVCSYARRFSCKKCKGHFTSCYTS